LIELLDLLRFFRLDQDAGTRLEGQTESGSAGRIEISHPPSGIVYPDGVDHGKLVLPGVYPADHEAVEGDQFSDLLGHPFVNLFQVEGGADDPTDFGDRGHLLGQTLDGLLVP
jgi:hypothetical protein